MKTQVTIKDIAIALGMSPSTVSRALKGHPDISEATKTLVRDLAAKLEYEPNTMALNLRNQHSNFIGVVVPKIEHHFFASVISGIEDVAHASGYHVMVCQSNDSYEREKSDVNALISNRVAGLLISFSKETMDFEHLMKAQKKGVPLVFFDRICEEMDTSSVIVDDFGGAFRATEHLIEQGCKRIAHLAGTGHLMLSQNRLEGYMEALAKHGLPFDEQLVVTCDTYSTEEGTEKTKILLELPSPPDGIFANNDMSALGAMRAAQAKGLRIPEEIAIVGYSDWQMATLVRPTLSMIAQPSYEMGKVSAEILLQHIKSPENDPALESRILATGLIVRDSSNRKG